jgi:hypothetical protein
VTSLLLGLFLANSSTDSDQQHYLRSTTKQGAIGIDYVIVNGEVLLEGGERIPAPCQARSSGARCMTGTVRVWLTILDEHATVP